MKPFFRRSAWLMLLMLAAGVLTACQPTPETPVVVNKGDNHLEKMIESSAVSAMPAESADGTQSAEQQEALMAALRERVGAPETFADTYTNTKGDVSVTIDAVIEVPPVERIPALVVTLGGFPQEQVDRFAAYFLKGAPVYTAKNVRTKEEIMSDIVEQRRYIEMLKDGASRGDLDALIEDSERYIKELEKQYADAPEQWVSTPATTQLTETEGGQSVEVVADLGKEGDASFCVYNPGRFMFSGFIFTNDGRTGPLGGYATISGRADPLEGIPRGMTTAYEDAEKIVMQALSDLGIRDMQIAGVGSAIFCRDFNEDMNDNTYKATAPQCYVFSLLRTVGGIPISQIEASTPLDTDDPNVSAPPEPDYAYMAEPESMEIYVDDTGIVSFDWRNPVRIESVLSENVTLLPFEDVVRRAKDNMFYKNYTAYGSTANIKIDKIQLNIMRIMRQDKPGEYLIVPVWDFVGKQSGFGDQSFVTINAIDGSNIRRDWGY
jgi:hypothetical protein